MVYSIFIYLHVIVCIGLIAIVLVQAGRGGGLSETFSGAEAIFGTKTNAMLTKATALFAIIFFITCLSLALISKQRSQSLIEGKKITVKPQTNTSQTHDTAQETINQQNLQSNQTQTQSPPTNTTQKVPEQKEQK